VPFRAIPIPDPASPVPMLEQLRDALAKSDPGGGYAGITYDLTDGNELRGDWLVQSPNRWGRKANDLTFYPLSKPLPGYGSDADCNGGTCSTIWSGRRACLGRSDALVLQVLDLIASARRRVDIALLQPAPDARFLEAMRAALETLARSGRPAIVGLSRTI
jgi:hypothetical protein